MAEPIRPNIYNFAFLLLLLLIQPTNSMKEIEAQADPKASTGVVIPGKEEKSVSCHQKEPTNSKPKKQEVRSLGEEVTQKELAAVNGNISAVYIIRVIHIRAEALKKLKTETMAHIPNGTAINEELNPKPKEITEVLKEVAEVPKEMAEVDSHQHNLKKVKKRGKTEEEKMREIYVALWKDSNLLDAEMENLTAGELVGALKEVDKKDGYLEKVDGLISKFQKDIPELHKIALRFNWLSSDTVANQFNPPANPIEICEKLRVEYVDFLKQIRLEIELHYMFKSLDLEEFEAITGKLMDAEYITPNEWNNAVKNVYKDIAAVLKSPLKNGSDFVTSLSEVAEMVKADGNNLHEAEGKLAWGKHFMKNRINNISGAVAVVDSTFRRLPELLWRKKIHDEIGVIVKAKNYLERLFFMCEDMHLMMTKLPSKLRDEIHDQIRDKLEMPMKWYSEMHAAYPNIQGDHKLTKEMAHLRVELLLAKTLLVYERLNAFYKIDGHYKIWKDKQMLPKDLLLKSYFDTFDVENQKNKEKGTGKYIHSI